MSGAPAPYRMHLLPRCTTAKVLITCRLFGSGACAKREDNGRQITGTGKAPAECTCVAYKCKDVVVVFPQESNNQEAIYTYHMYPYVLVHKVKPPVGIRRCTYKYVLQ